LLSEYQQLPNVVTYAVLQIQVFHFSIQPKILNTLAA